MVERARKFFRTRAKLEKLMGKFYFKEMSDKEYKEKEHLFLYKVDEIKTQEELTQLMAKEQTIRDPYGLPQYKGLYVEKYRENESAFIFKAHHCLADGMAFIAMTASLCDEFHPEHIPAMRKLSLFKKIYVYSLLVFSILSVGIKLLLSPKERNAIHKGNQLSGIKNSSVSCDVSVSKLKEKSK